MNRSRSSKGSEIAQSGVPLMPSSLEWGILLAIELLVMVMVKSVGSRRGLELMPWPDGLEYAAAAVNLAKGRGPVLHFGGYTYPSRYTAGYPLLLEFLSRLFSRQAPLLWIPTFVMALITAFMVFYMARLWIG